MKLTNWKGKGYKSIEQGEFDASNETILIGKNNSGKSNILKSLLDLNTLFDSGKALNWFIPRVIGKDPANEIILTYTFDLSEDERDEILGGVKTNERTKAEERDWLGATRYHVSLKSPDKDDVETNHVFEIWWDNEWEEVGNLRNIEGEGDSRTFPVLVKDVMSESIETWKFVSPFRIPEDTGRAVYKESVRFRPDGSNLVHVLANLKMGEREEIYNDIVSKYVDVMESVEDIKIKFDEEGSHQSDLTLHVEESHFDQSFKLDEIASGSKEILTLLTQIYLSQEDTDLLGIEEPELHLHPGAEKKVYSVIEELVEEHEVQVIISTHSDVFVNQSDPGGIVKVDRSESSELKSLQKGEIREELANLGYSKSGLLQSDAVVFVEGLSDKLILSQIGSNLGYDMDELGISIVELEGEGNVGTHGRSLVKLLYSFDIPYRFIVDSDDDSPSDVVQAYVDKINRTEDDGGWWHTKPEYFHAWEDSDIEYFLIEATRAISNTVEEDEIYIETLIDESDSEDNVGVLEYIWSEVYEDPHDEVGYQKDIDGKNIAKHMTEGEMKDELIQEIEAVVNLV